jgi:hypothetical protein
MKSHYLDPVVQAAMTHLTSWVYPPLRQRIRRHAYGQGKWARNLRNPSNRAATIHTCKHLKHHGYALQPDQLRDWALMGGRAKTPTNFTTMQRAWVWGLDITRPVTPWGCSPFTNCGDKQQEGIRSLISRLVLVCTTSAAMNPWPQSVGTSH